MSFPLVPPDFILRLAFYDALEAKVSRLIYAHVKHVTVNAHVFDVIMCSEFAKGAGLYPCLHSVDVLFKLRDPLSNETAHNPFPFLFEE
jgi:hypothetical protein